MSDKPARELLPGEAEVDAWIDTLEQRVDAMSDEETASEEEAVEIFMLAFGWSKEEAEAALEEAVASGELTVIPVH